MKHLIEYRGGGYDGCFWEWNYYLVGPNNYFQDIFSSGLNGCKSRNELKQYMKDKDKFYLYPLNNLKEFIQESAPQNVFGVVKYLNENDIQETYLDCPECDNDFCEFGYGNEGLVLHPSDYSGNGGIGVNYHSWICTACLSNQSCLECSEWIGKDDSSDWANYKKDDPIQENYGPLCIWCYGKLEDEAKGQKLVEIMSEIKERWIESGYTIPDSLVSDNWQTNPAYQIREAI